MFFAATIFNPSPFHLQIIDLISFILLRLIRYCQALEQFQDKESLELANTLKNLARLYASQGKVTDSLKQYKIVLNMQSQVLPGSHRIIAQTLKEMGNTSESLRRYGEALGQYNAALVMERIALATCILWTVIITTH